METLTNYPSVDTEVLKIYLTLIVNSVCLFYVYYTQQLQLLYLFLVYEKEVVFVLKSRHIVVKIDGLTLL